MDIQHAFHSINIENMFVKHHANKNNVTFLLLSDLINGMNSFGYISNDIYKFIDYIYICSLSSQLKFQCSSIGIS